MKITKYVLLFLILISGVNAVMISEIMYNPLGSDSDREWIEIYNDGAEISLEDWKLKENGVNHQLSLYQGSFVLPQDEFIIIVDDPVDFLNDYSYTGTILDSSFSLKNSGEEIAILDKDLNEIDKVTYTDIAQEGYSIIYSEDMWEEGEMNGSPGEIHENIDEVPEFRILGIISIVAVIILYRNFT